MKRKIKNLVKMTVQNFLLPVIYRICCLFKKADRNLVVFADSHSTELPFSMKKLYEEMSGTSFEIHTCIWDNSKLGFMSVVRHTMHFMTEYASAGTVIICDNFLPVSSCRKRAGTKVIQLWHAGGALKRFGYDAEDDIPGGYRGKVYKNYDLVTVSSEQVIKYFASAMHLPESCFVPWGLSRTDCFFDKDYCSRIRESFYKRYPGACGKKIVLWAPTFRGNAGDPRVIGAADIDRAAELTKKDYFMIRSLHPHMREKESADAFFCAEELLVVADILITDYSSILFDFLLFGRPVIRFTPDYGEYCRDRGFYMPYESLPGRQVCDGGELEAAIRSAGDEYDAGAARSIRDYAMGACDGKATSRVIRYIKNGGHNK